MEYDAVVVGAGVAGSIAAYILAKEGFKVAIIEKEELPRYKLCGGAISNKTLNFLKKIGIKIDEDIVENRIKEVEVHTPNFSRYLHVDIGILTYRDKFDYFLTKHAINNNCSVIKARFIDLKQNEDVQIKTTKGTLRARYLIGCDGVNSTVLIKSRLGKIKGENLVLAIESEYRDAEFDVLKLYFGYVNFGYAWIFPKRHGTTVGIGTFSNDSKRTLKSSFSKFIKDVGLKPIKFMAHNLPYAGSVKKPSKGKVAVAGDAASCVDALLGEGTFFAALSGYLAAESVIEALEKDSNLKNYNKKFKKIIAPELNTSIKLSNLFYSNMNFSYFILEKGGFEDILKKIANSSKPFTSVYKKVILHALKRYPEFLLRKLFS